MIWAGVAILERMGDEVYGTGRDNRKSPDDGNTQSQAHSTRNHGSRQFEEKIPKEIEVERQVSAPKGKGLTLGLGKGHKTRWNSGNASLSRRARKLIGIRKVCSKYTWWGEEAAEITGHVNRACHVHSKFFCLLACLLAVLIRNSETGQGRVSKLKTAAEKGFENSHQREQVRVYR